MDKYYDILDDGIGKLIADMKKLEEDLLWTNQVVIASLEPMILSNIKFYGSMNTNLDNWRAVNSNNVFTYRRNKVNPSIRVVNTDSQTTYAEYGYGIIGEKGGSPLYPMNEIFGDVGWRGYGLPSPYKRYHKNDGGQYWFYSRFGQQTYTQGEVGVPTFYRTYLNLERSLPTLFVDRFIAVINKL
jgi:hypothetical protein